MGRAVRLYTKIPAVLPCKELRNAATIIDTTFPVSEDEYLCDAIANLGNVVDCLLCDYRDYIRDSDSVQSVYADFVSAMLWKHLLHIQDVSLNACLTASAFIECPPSITFEFDDTKLVAAFEKLRMNTPTTEIKV